MKAMVAKLYIIAYSQTAVPGCGNDYLILTKITTPYQASYLFEDHVCHKVGPITHNHQ